MINAKIDMRKLERSLKRAAGRFGETNKQAVVRWGVESCRQLAFETQVFGNGGAKKKQTDAIKLGMIQVLDIRPAREFNRMMKRGTARNPLTSPKAISEFVDSKRGSKGRTKKLPWAERGTCKKADFTKAVTMRSKLAGIAKGAWLGAGIDIAKAQRGTQRISIGKNYMAYAQKHSTFGASKKPVPGFHPVAALINKAKHSASKNVMSRSGINEAIAKGAKRAATWYRREAKEALDKA